MNTSVNLQISGLTDMDLDAVSTPSGKTWIAFYHLNGGAYELRAQLLDSNGVKLLGPDGVLVSNHPTGTPVYDINICVDDYEFLVIGCSELVNNILTAKLYKVTPTGTLFWGPDGMTLSTGHSPYPCSINDVQLAVAWDGDLGNVLVAVMEQYFGDFDMEPTAVPVGNTVTTHGQVVVNSTTRFTILCQSVVSGTSSTLWAQAFEDFGGGFGWMPYLPAVQLSDQSTSTDNYYSLIADGEITYCGYYTTSSGRQNSFLQRIDPNVTLPWGINGSHFSTALAPGDNNQGPTNIMTLPGSDYVWAVSTFSNPTQTQYGVYTQKFLKTTGARQFTDAAKIVYPVSASKDQDAGPLYLVGENPIFLSYDATYKIYVTRLNSSGNFVWPGNRVEISSTTATTATPKQYFGFTPAGATRFAGTWSENRGSGYHGYIQSVTANGLFGISVATQGNVPPIISNNNGTLQMVDTIFPSTASQNVIWSIVPGTGNASISTTGLVTAIANGTVWAKAVAVQDSFLKDSLMITISGQTLPPTVTTLPATNVTMDAATLNGTVIANNSTTTVTFEWGLTMGYGNTVTATPSTVTGITPVDVSANISGLEVNTTYHYRCKGVNSKGTTYGADMTLFTGCYPPGSPGDITGSTEVCGYTAGVTYSIPPITYATGYQWTLPSGAYITSGYNTNTITVTFGNTSGNVTVYGTNICANGPSSSLPVTVDQAPTPTITGDAYICLPSTTGNYTTEAGMTNYVWTVSPGGVLIAGSGTNSVQVNWYETGGQWISVNYSAGGCSAQTPTTLLVSVSPHPAPPTITQVGIELVSDAPFGNQWYSSDLSDGTYLPIPSANGQTYMPYYTAYYADAVTLNQCTSAQSNIIYVDITGVPEKTTDKITIYPVPNDGMFRVAFDNPTTEPYSAEVINALGVPVFYMKNISQAGQLIDLRPAASGVYTVILENSQRRVVKRVLVER